MSTEENNMEIKFTVENNLNRGRNTGHVTAVIRCPEQNLEYKAINYLERFFPEIPKGVRCSSTTWGKMHNSYDGFLQFVHQAKYKKDHMSGEEILGFLTSRYGDLEKYIRKCITTIIKKLELIERAKSCMREAEHIGKCFSDEAYNKAVKRIGYKEKLASLNNMLRAAISEEYDKLIKNDKWTYQDGTPMDPVSVQLLLTQDNHFKKRAMPSGAHFPRSLDHLFNEYEAHWLAAVIESMEDKA